MPIQTVVAVQDQERTNAPLALVVSWMVVLV